MTDSLFPPLPLTEWQDTRDTIKGYANLTGEIRSALTPAQKHYWHASLSVAASGLTTTPIRSGTKTFELLLDFTNHDLVITTSHNERQEIALLGQSPRTFKDQTLSALAEFGIADPGIDHDQFAGEELGSYDPAAVTKFWQAISQIDSVLKELRSGFREESGPVRLWPHGFDIAVLWFSGRLIPGQDPNRPDYADEQMNFGFTTGDGGIPEPYFYVTAYPNPPGWVGSALPKGAYWQKEGWAGAVLLYKELVGREDGRAYQLNFLKTAFASASKIIKGGYDLSKK